MVEEIDAAPDLFVGELADLAPGVGAAPVDVAAHRGIRSALVIAAGEEEGIVAGRGGRGGGIGVNGEGAAGEAIGKWSAVFHVSRGALLG